MGNIYSYSITTREFYSVDTDDTAIIPQNKPLLREKYISSFWGES